MSAAVLPELTLEYDYWVPDKPISATPIVLVMGLGCQLVHWPLSLVKRFLDSGYPVLRFDNRDSGLSSQFDHLPPIRYRRRDLIRWRLGVCLPSHYRIADMATDTIALLDHLDIPRAHLVGASMGGMIVQELAIDYGQRLASATMIMSTTGRRSVGGAKLSLVRKLRQRPTSNDADALIEHGVGVWRLLQGRKHRSSDEELRESVTRAVQRAQTPMGYLRQMQAIMNAEDRGPRLRGVQTPSLVLHGLDDRLIHASGGRAVAGAIPGARLVEIEGWGHDFPASLHARISELILDHAQASGSAPGSTPSTQTA